MFPVPEQFSTAAKAQLEAQLKIFHTLTGKAFEGAQQLIAFNLHASKQALEQHTSSARQLLGINNPSELLAFSGSHAQPNIDSLLAYSRLWFGIASGAQVELIEAAKASPEAAAAPKLEVVAAPKLAVVAPRAPVAEKPILAPVPGKAAAPAAVLAKTKAALKVEAKPVIDVKPAAKPASVATPAAKPVVVAVQTAAVPVKPTVAAAPPPAAVAKAAVSAAKPPAPKSTDAKK
ncbi:phasin family protein [Oxalobacteraceae bacterium GrIS 1.11]